MFRKSKWSYQDLTRLSAYNSVIMVLDIYPLLNTRRLSCSVIRLYAYPISWLCCFWRTWCPSWDLVGETLFILLHHCSTWPASLNIPKTITGICRSLQCDHSPNPMSTLMCLQGQCGLPCTSMLISQHLGIILQGRFLWYLVSERGCYI